MMTDPRTCPLVTVDDFLYIRAQAPDLALQEEFLTEVGMVTAHRTPTSLYMRGTGSAPYIHVTTLGDPTYVALGYRARSEDDLRRLAGAPGASPMETVKEPGGGNRVVLTEPNGYRIEVVHGQAPVDELSLPRLPVNSATAPNARRGRGPWAPDARAHVIRLAHAVLRTEKFDASAAWYRNTLGFACSDQAVDENGQVEGVFNRVDRGEEFSDHHSLLVAKANRTGWHHLGLEVWDWNEVFSGAAYLRNRPHVTKVQPPNRHLVGGQVGAYVLGPWDQLFEIFSDVDRLNARHTPMQWTAHQMSELSPKWYVGESRQFRDVLVK